MPETDLLSRYLDGEKDVDFSYDSHGTGDCLTFMAGWVLLWQGIDYASDFRGRYHDEAGAKALITARGGAVSYLTEKFGAPRSAAGGWQRGDIGLLPFDGWYLGMICLGNLWALRGTPRGVRYTRRSPEVIWTPNAARIQG